MDALTVLKREHTRILQLFDEFAALPKRACLGRLAIVREIDTLLRRHIKVEESVFYGNAAGRTCEAHAAALRALDELSSIDCRDDSYVTLVLALRDVLAAHIREEEANVFPSYAEVA